jgi:hypothetical protein
MKFKSPRSKVVLFATSAAMIGLALLLVAAQSYPARSAEFLSQGWVTSWAVSGGTQTGADNVLGPYDDVLATFNLGGGYCAQGIVLYFADYTLRSDSLLRAYSMAVDQPFGIYLHHSGEGGDISNYTYAGWYSGYTWDGSEFSLEDFAGLEIDAVMFSCATSVVLDALGIENVDYSPPAEPTSTPAPIYPTGTSWAYMLPCVTGTPHGVATAYRTPTPTGTYATPTPGHTATGTLRTPTPSATPRATIPAGTLGDVANFNGPGLSPWVGSTTSSVQGNALGNPYYYPYTGADSAAGVAVLPFLIYRAEPVTDTFPAGTIYMTGVFTAPVRVAGQMKTDPMLVEESGLFPEQYQYLMVYYYDEASVSWRASDLVRARNSWDPFAVKLSASFTHTTGIAISAVNLDRISTATTISASITVRPDFFIKADGTADVYGGDEGSRVPAILVDQLRIMTGDQSDFGVMVCLPGQGGSGNGGTDVPPQICQVEFRPVDMFAVCTAPTDALDLGAWLSYLWCNISRYFGYYDENRQQWDAIIDRQSVNEPFGSLIEIGDVYGDVQDQADLLAAHNKYQAQDPIDWVKTFTDFSALDHLPQFTMPDLASAGEYMTECPQEVADFSNSTSAGACMALYMMRRTSLITIIQWVFNAVIVIGLLLKAKDDLGQMAS